MSNCWVWIASIFEKHFSFSPLFSPRIFECTVHSRFRQWFIASRDNATRRSATTLKVALRFYSDTCMSAPTFERTFQNAFVYTHMYIYFTCIRMQHAANSVVLSVNSRSVARIVALDAHIHTRIHVCAQIHTYARAHTHNRMDRMCHQCQRSRAYTVKA